MKTFNYDELDKEAVANMSHEDKTLLDDQIANDANLIGIAKYHCRAKLGLVEDKRGSRGKDLGPRKTANYVAFLERLENSMGITPEGLASDQFEMTRWLMKEAYRNQDFDQMVSATVAMDKFNKTFLPYIAIKAPTVAETTSVKVNTSLEDLMNGNVTIDITPENKDEV